MSFQTAKNIVYRPGGLSDEDSEDSDYDLGYGDWEQPKKDYYKVKAEEPKELAKFIPVHEIRFACQLGELEELKKFITDFELDINKPLIDTWTLLFFAAESSHAHIVKYLIDNKANVKHSIGYEDNINVLMVAASSRKDEEKVKETVKTIIENADIDVNFINHMGCSALKYAIAACHPEVVNYLLANGGAKLDIYETAAQKPLELGILSGNGKIVRILLEHGAKLDTVYYSGLKPCELAMLKRQNEISTILYNLEMAKWKPAGGEDPENALLKKLDSVNSKNNTDENIEINEPKNHREIQQIECILRTIELHKYIDLFKVNNIQFKDLMSMNKNDLENLGVKEVGARIKILNVIRKMYLMKWIPDCIPSNTEEGKVNACDAYTKISNIGSQISIVSSIMNCLKTKTAPYIKPLKAPNKKKGKSEEKDNKKIDYFDKDQLFGLGKNVQSIIKSNEGILMEAEKLEEFLKKLLNEPDLKSDQEEMSKGKDSFKSYVIASSIILLLLGYCFKAKLYN